MADEKPLCPTCHSYIESDPAKAKRVQGAVKAGELTTLPDGRLVRKSNSGAIPQWTDDPTFNNPDRGLPLNGTNYRGFTRATVKQLQEIQDARMAEEIDAGIPTKYLTQFTPLEAGKTKILARLFIELRQSTEKLLNAIGITLKDYFSMDIEGNVIVANPNDPAGDNKEEWTDTQRGAEYVDSDGKIQTEFILPDGTKQKSPTVLRGTRYKTIHLEDLRHPVPTGWREFWATAVPMERPLETNYNVKEYSHNYSNTGVPSNFIMNGISNRYFTRYYCVPWPTFTIEPYHHSTASGYDEGYLSADPNKFPNNLDIHPSDGGNKYLYDYIDKSDAKPAYGITIYDEHHNTTGYKIDNTWILFGKSESYSRVGSSSGFWSGGDACPVTILVGSTSGGSSESKAKVAIIEDANSNVMTINPNAKALHLYSEAKCAYTISGFNVANGTPSEAFIGINHNWKFDPSIGILGEEGGKGLPNEDSLHRQLDLASLQDKNIKVSKNLYFKFVAEIKSKVGAWYGNFSFIDNPNFDKVDYMSRFVAGVRSNLYPRPLPTHTFEKDSRYGGFQPNYNLFVGQLSLNMYGFSGPIFVQFIPTNPPSPLNDPNLIKHASGLYGGQIFTFVKPTTNTKNHIIIFLGDTPLHDVSICLDDLLYAFSTIGGPTYVSHKKRLDDGTIVENPNGTVTYLTQIEFWVDSASGWIGTPPDMISSGWPDCTLQIIDGTMTNYSSELEVSLSGIRLESNPDTAEEAANKAEEAANKRG